MSEATELYIEEPFPAVEPTKPPEPIIEAGGRLAVLNQLNQATSAMEQKPDKFDGAAIRRRVRSRSKRESTSLDSVQQYLKEIGQHPLIKAEEECTLSKQIEDGRIAKDTAETTGILDDSLRLRIEQGNQAKEKFIKSNLRLVVSIAKRYPLPPGMDLLDLIQEGNLGLEHAVDKFDWRRGFKFSTYATFWVRQAIGRSIDYKGNLVRPRNGSQYLLRAALREVDGDPDQLDKDMAQVWALTSPVSLDHSYGESGDEQSSMHNYMRSKDKSVEEQAIADVETAKLYAWLDKLPAEKHRIAIIEHYGLFDKSPKTYRDIGNILGITAEGARRLVKRSEELLTELAN